MVGRQGGWRSWGHRVARGVRRQWGVEGEDGVWDDIVTLWRRLLRGRSIAVGVRTGRGGLVVQGARKRAVGGMHVVPAGRELRRLGLRLGHYG